MQKKIKKKFVKVGLLGGTFDPPHKGHLGISKIALKKLKLNKVIWLITKQNPFKSKPYFSIKKRYQLSKKILKNEKKIQIKYLENRVKSQNIYNLLNYLKKREKNIKFYFLMGMDNLINFHKWHKWKKICQLAKIVIFPRKDYSIKSLNYFISIKMKKKKFIYINSKKFNISSSNIKKKW